MTEHVDMIENDFWKHEQRLHARVTAAGIGPAHIEYAMLESIVKQMGNGSYFFALGPHEGKDCPFKRGPVPMEPVPVPKQPMEE